MERRRWLCSCAIVTAAAIHVPLRLESDVNQTAAAARESFIYADLVAVAAVEKPDAQACSTSVDLHHVVGETGEVGRYCFHCNKDHVARHTSGATDVEKSCADFACMIIHQTLDAGVGNVKWTLCQLSAEWHASKMLQQRGEIWRQCIFQKRLLRRLDQRQQPIRAA